MHVLIATSEAVPFAKTGGLADVCGALPLELTKIGVQATLIMPAYPQVFNAGIAIEPTGISVEVPIGNKTVTGRIMLGHLTVPATISANDKKTSGKNSGDKSSTATEEQEVPVYFIEQNDYFNRPNLYQQAGEDYRDNCERYVFFCRAVMEAVRKLSLQVDVLHCNDWQTGLIPALHKIEYRAIPGFEQMVTMMTVHNMAYQGVFWHWDMLLTGLDWKYFNWRQMECYGNLSLLKTGLVFSDAITTVSPTYAKEVETTSLGCGLEGVLQHRHDALSGILNGVDYTQWDPAIDEHLTQQYSVANYKEGKLANKTALQKELNLPVDPNVPLIAFVGRIADQKGIDLILDVMRQWLPERNAQWVILGTGDPRAQEALQSLAKQHPTKFAVRLEFSDKLAHQIEAAADIFLMPSRFEPCGLSQLYSLKYGTVPVVRSTGGLADTITDTTPETLANNTATGFAFADYHSLALGKSLDQAVANFAQPAVWDKIIKNGMSQDWSWTRSAREYQRLYETLSNRARATNVSTLA